MKQALVIGVILVVCAVLVAGSLALDGSREASPVFETVDDTLPPAAVLNVETEIAPPKATQTAQTAAAEASEVPAASETADFDETTTVRVLFGDEVKEMALADYLPGVLAAEMPASFEPEALKAQAVAARTNVVRKLFYGGKHDNADVCTDSTCCMGWKEPDNPVFAQAVSGTDGEVVTYEGKVIDAVFFASSWGSTEAAVEVWGASVPYLVSVQSPEEPEKTDTVTVPLTDFCLTVRSYSDETDFSGDWIGDIAYTDAGAVKTAVIGGVSFTGPQIRSMFGLDSACFTLELTPTGAVFTTRGHGHGVGLSQYGANAMAQAGSDHYEILKWYYTHTDVTVLGAQ